jgi:RNA polymerase sigma-70 factor (ECF subfamily)
MAMPHPILTLLTEGAAKEVSDAGLVEQARSGSDPARRALYDRHFDLVMSRVTHLLGRSVEAEDVVQDAFESAFRDLERLDDPNRFAAWLCRIAINQVHRRFRRRRLRQAFGLDDGVDDASLDRVMDTSSDAASRLRLIELDRALRQVTTTCRIAWMLRHVEGCELKEVADQCGCSVAAAKRRIASAEKRLFSYIDWNALEARGR